MTAFASFAALRENKAVSREGAKDAKQAEGASPRAKKLRPLLVVSE
ncbi:MAG: hypothetical protein HZC55_28570 [Verrucomicrobia bacterium]|nr:hypothetical protein [Verrucomicrobiota bacterium]